MPPPPQPQPTQAPTLPPYLTLTYLYFTLPYLALPLSPNSSPRHSFEFGFFAQHTLQPGVCRFYPGTSLFGMATTEAPLRTEPAPLEEPEKQPVFPKSFAEVVQEEVPTDEKNGTHELNGTNGTMTTEHTEIADKGVPGEGREEVVTEDRPQSEKDELENGYAVDVCVSLLYRQFLNLTSAGRQ